MRYRTLSTLVTLLVCAGATVAPGLVPTASAQTVSCWGDWCSGLDPMNTNCAADAYTVASNYVYGSGGTTYVEIRWSPTCKTNWARANFVTSNIKALQSTGYTQGYSADNGAVSWSKMIYSPTLCVEAVIWGGWGATETACV
jgi:hypothetical protein